jgi:hypothetical protein
MSVNSLESLLARMRQGSVTQGWGAISVLNRGRLNRLLEQQYIERFNGYSFLPPFTGRVSLGQGSYDYVELQNIALGQPLLSFSTASLTNSIAVLTMNIIAGRYTASRQTPGASSDRLSAFNITEAQGFKLELEIDLSMVVGEVDKRGKVKFDLAQGVNFHCNIAGDDEAANSQFADFFKQHFDALPENRSVFQLGMLDLKGYSNLTPTTFRILTQAAPGAKVRGALNYGDGGVVTFIRLQANTADGNFPPDANFPYLIPDDQEGDGSDRYSASLILAEDMIEYIEDGELDVLNSLLFPGQNVFEERERHSPRDLAVFGNINPKQTRITLEPAFKTLKAGDTQRFTLHDWKGQPIQASKWSAVSLQSHTQEGHGTMVDGSYTAASKALIGHDSIHVVVTAEYISGGVTYSASALLLVVYDELEVAPRVATFAARTQTQPIVLTASPTDDVQVTWSLLAPEYGGLAQSGLQALFTPDARARVKGLVVQRVEVTGAQKRESSLVLVNAQQQLRIDPPYVPALKKNEGVQLRDDATLLPGVPRRWKVISGGGTVDATGRYTAPALGNTASSVVQCEIVRNGVVLSGGYCVIDLSEMNAEPTWKELAQFTVKVPGAVHPGRLGSLFGNGYQQARVEILVETVPVDGKPYPLSVIEKASMRLVDHTTKAEIEFVDDALDGIPEGDAQVWRTRLIPNRFDLAIPRMAAADTVTADPAISLLEFYVHTRERAGTTVTFHATFQADSNQHWWKSVDIVDVNETIELTPLAMPVLNPDAYTFERVRVDGGSGGSGPGDDPDEADFDFHLRTIDYWKLRYNGTPGAPGTTFETLEFLSSDGTTAAPATSIIRWESEQLAETMFSWTGWIFQDSNASTVDENVRFDIADKDIVNGKESLIVKVYEPEFEKGLLVITLHRSDRIVYVRAGDKSRDKLSRDLAVKLIDRNGNAHFRRISYLPPSVPGNRNRLVHTLFTP